MGLGSFLKIGFLGGLAILSTAFHGQRFKRLGNLKAVYDALPLDFGLLKID